MHTLNILEMAAVVGGQYYEREVIVDDGSGGGGGGYAGGHYFEESGSNYTSGGYEFMSDGGNGYEYSVSEADYNANISAFSQDAKIDIEGGWSQKEGAFVKGKVSKSF